MTGWHIIGLVLIQLWYLVAAAVVIAIPFGIVMLIWSLHTETMVDLDHLGLAHLHTPGHYSSEREWKRYWEEQEGLGER